VAYITAADVQAEFKSVTFGSGAAVGSSAVTTFIAQEEAWLNAQIGGVISTPVGSSVTCFPLIQMLATKRVKARLLDILYVRSGETKTEQAGGATAASLRKEVDELVAQIRKREIPLDGATLQQSNGAVASYVLDQTDSDDEITPTFERDTDAW
jgi:hypothetical protein